MDLRLTHSDLRNVQQEDAAHSGLRCLRREERVYSLLPKRAWVNWCKRLLETRAVGLGSASVLVTAPQRLANKMTFFLLPQDKHRRCMSRKGLAAKTRLLTGRSKAVKAVGLCQASSADPVARLDLPLCHWALDACRSPAALA